MMYVPINWTFQKKSDILPIMEARGESTDKECECAMIQDVIEVVNMAREFNGIPYQIIPPPFEVDVDTEIVINFALLFPSEEELDDFMEAI